MSNNMEVNIMEQIIEFFQSLVTVLAAFFSRLYEFIVSIKYGG